MKHLLPLVLLALPTVAPSQRGNADEPPDLSGVEAVFRDLHDLPGAAIVIVPGRAPLILLKGSHDQDVPVTDQSLVPLGVLSRQLFADALQEKLRRDLAEVHALSLGLESLSAAELLRGSDRLPDYLAWPGGNMGKVPAMDREALLHCAQVAADARSRFVVSRGMSELVILESLLRGDRIPDLPSALRTALAPHVPGLDPRDLRELSEAEKKLVIRGTRAPVDIAGAEPAAARLVLPVRALAEWMAWRMKDPSGLVTGERAGRTWEVGDSTAEDPVQTWTMFSGSTGSATIQTYPKERTMLVVAGLYGHAVHQLGAALRSALYGDRELYSEAFEMLDVDDQFERRVDLTSLAGASWVSEGGAMTVKVTGDTLTFRDAGGNEYRADSILAPTENAWDMDLHTGSDGTEHRVILVLDQDPRRSLRMVWVRRTKENGTFPSYFVLTPKDG